MFVSGMFVYCMCECECGLFNTTFIKYSCNLFFYFFPRCIGLDVVALSV